LQEFNSDSGIKVLFFSVRIRTVKEKWNSGTGFSGSTKRVILIYLPLTSFVFNMKGMRFTGGTANY
jgi:hypothetical protein